ncbi:MAG: GNAT family N-acetyltransferase [Chloroflexi bacterium]|nr:GNAT family N-acetyltransferase [Chloroflexota bacterium]MDA1145801.1 GNAT family N-acetyltransferase [Chloroflexota bacterium]
MNGEPRLELTDQPTRVAVAAVEDGLAAFNEQQAGRVDARDLAVLIRDPETDETIGGLIGRTSLGLFFADLVYVPAGMRGSGFGTRVMQLAEEEAIRRGCSTALLYTIVFQAPEFYARLGYTEVGRVECAPPGHTRVVMSKLLR